MAFTAIKQRTVSNTYCESDQQILKAIKASFASRKIDQPKGRSTFESPKAVRQIIREAKADKLATAKANDDVSSHTSYSDDQELSQNEKNLIQDAQERKQSRQSNQSKANASFNKDAHVGHPLEELSLTEVHTKAVPGSIPATIDCIEHHIDRSGRSYMLLYIDPATTAKLGKPIPYKCKIGWDYPSARVIRVDIDDQKSCAKLRSITGLATKGGRIGLNQIIGVVIGVVIKDDNIVYICPLMNS